MPDTTKVRVEVVDKMMFEGCVESENVNGYWDGHDSCNARNRKLRLPVTYIGMKPQTMQVVQHAQKSNGLMFFMLMQRDQAS